MYEKIGAPRDDMIKNQNHPVRPDRGRRVALGASASSSRFPPPRPRPLGVSRLISPVHVVENARLPLRDPLTTPPFPALLVKNCPQLCHGKTRHSSRTCARTAPSGSARCPCTARTGAGSRCASRTRTPQSRKARVRSTARTTAATPPRRCPPARPTMLRAANVSTVASEATKPASMASGEARRSSSTRRGRRRKRSRGFLRRLLLGVDRPRDGRGAENLTFDLWCPPGTDRPRGTRGGRSRHDGADPAQCRRHVRRETRGDVFGRVTRALTARRRVGANEMNCRRRGALRQRTNIRCVDPVDWTCNASRGKKSSNSRGYGRLGSFSLVPSTFRNSRHVNASPGKRVHSTPRPPTPLRPQTLAHPSSFAANRMRSFPFLLLSSVAVLSSGGRLASEAPADPPCPRST